MALLNFFIFHFQVQNLFTTGVSIEEKERDFIDILTRKIRNDMICCIIVYLCIAPWSTRSLHPFSKAVRS